MKKWGIGLCILALLCAAFVALPMTGIWAPPWEPKTSPPTSAAVVSSDGSLSVRQGQDALYPSREGSPEVSIPGGALSGEGSLQVRPVTLSKGRSGWDIDLTGVQLTGVATITFKNAVVEGRPVPLVGFTENPGDLLEYVSDVEVSGSDLIVRTAHFSTWWVDSMEWMRDELDRIYSASGYDEQPRCNDEAKVREKVRVESDSGGSVKWCLGLASDGTTVLKVNNARGYAASIERTPGLRIANRSMVSFGDMIPNLIAEVSTPASKPGNVIDVVGPGETIEYQVTESGTAGVRVDPSGAAYLATALWFGAETAQMVFSGATGKNVDLEAVGIAMDAANCVGGFQTLATSDVINAQRAGKYLNDAIDMTMACNGKVMEVMAKKAGTDEVFLTGAASWLSWLWSGMRTFGNAVGGTAGSLLDLDGYRVILSYDSPGPGGPFSDSALPLGDNSALVGTWKGPVYGDNHGYDMVLQLQELEGALSGTVNYPQLKCGGTWTMVAREPSMVSFTETITQDTDDRCVKIVPFTITRTETGLHALISYDGRRIDFDLVKQ